MTVENIAPGDNGEPWLYVQTVIEQGHSVSYCRHQAAWKDTCDKAQLSANNTGRVQYLVAYPGTGARVTHMVTPDAAQHQAYGGRQL